MQQVKYQLERIGHKGADNRGVKSIDKMQHDSDNFGEYIYS
jgi:hypothetical protein